MVKIRFARRGKKNRPFYRIVVIDKRKKRDGMPLEELGSYDPITKELKVDKAKIDEWVKKGAITSRTVASILKKK